MIEILLIKGSNIKSIATIEHVNTCNEYCNDIVYSIAKAIHNYGTVVDRTRDTEYPIAYRINMKDNLKVVARDINE